MEITLQYFDDCPNWRITDRRLRQLIAEGIDASVTYEVIDSAETAARRGFGGSPTVLIEGVDPFAETAEPAGLACRVYQTETGPAGSPSVDQLRAAIARKRR
jgi:hypothetical protein